MNEDSLSQPALSLSPPKLQEKERKATQKEPLIRGATPETQPATRDPALEASKAIQEQLLRSIEKQFQGGLVLKALEPLYHSTLGQE